MYHPVKERNMEALVQYQRHLFENPKLTFLFLELTDKCNLNCAHCGSRCTARNNTFLPFSIIKKTLEEVKNRYTAPEIMICITGGEPLLHPDLLKIVAYAHKLGFATGITSNGTLIDQKTAIGLQLAGLDTITLSIDGIGEAHDAFRGQCGSFEKTMEGVRNLRNAGIEPQALTVVHRDNMDKLDELFNFFVQNDFYSWRLSNVEPIGRAKASDRVLLSAEEVEGLLQFVRQKRFDNGNDMEVTYGCSHYLTLDYEREVRDYYFQCGAGTKVASIRANGDIVACLDIESKAELIQGNVYKDSFVDVWEKRFKVFRQDRAGLSQNCRECRHRRFCMGDSAHTWDFESNEPGYCMAREISGGLK